ncbi:MAG: GntR family transcriptional regulator [Lentisphaeria bacterium]|nr:GntR family transcriptional regulator [Lentisphaeria bacterium]NQZ67441.1 GntR family transcriptional regulator [Lentisphaeria bacterium]
MKLMDSIYRDLALRIIESRKLPILTLPSLAAHFGSSTRPVRQAVEKLIIDGLLVKSTNGRLSVSKKPAKKSVNQIQKQLKQSKSVGGSEQKLLNLLIDYSLSGHGDYLREEQLAGDFGIGRSRLRQIFMTYAGRGLLEHIPRCGWKVIPFRQDDMKHFIKVRKTLEDLALCESFDSLDTDLINDMLQNNKRALRAKVPVEDNRLHAYIIETSGNRYIETFFKQNAPYYELFFDWESNNAKLCRKASREHCAILQAVLDKDLSQARKALLAHIGYEHDFVKRSKSYERD